MYTLAKILAGSSTTSIFSDYVFIPEGLIMLASQTFGALF